MPSARVCMLVAVTSVLPLIVGWQDDVALDLKDPYTQFVVDKPGLGFFQGANAEVRLGRYLNGSENQAWRGGAEGDVALVNFGERILWQMGLNMETLADDQNDIHFRLVQVYYQGLTGIKLKLGSGVVHFGYRHRCNHGTDRATKARITIRSGLTTSYHWVIPIGALRLDVVPGVNLYMFGQNRDSLSQPKAGAYLSAGALWPIRGIFYMKMAAGANLELVTAGGPIVYALGDRITSWYVEPLYGAKVALRLAQDLVTADFGLHFAQNLDTGLGDNAKKSTAFSFDIDFIW